jgi:hypothetical protein
LVAREEGRECCIVEKCTLARNWLGSLNWLARRDIYRSVSFRRERDEVKATGCAEKGTDGVWITDTWELYDDAVAPLRLHERLRNAGGVHAALDDVSDGRDIRWRSDHVANWLYLILNAESAAQVKAELCLNEARPFWGAAVRETKVWE